MTQIVAIVNAAGRTLTDAKAMAPLKALQRQIDRDFVPAWGPMATPAKLIFVEKGHNPPKGAWPIYLNRHSTDPGALGWHTQEGTKIYGRVFVGDCLLYGISWTVDLSHELLEILGDPDAARTFQMENGNLAALEACDAVESDVYGYKINGVLVSDFVLPAYFSAGAGPYDFGSYLRGPCPSLTPGGYMSIEEDGQWTQVQADRRDGLRGRRSLMNGWRRRMRMQTPAGALTGAT